MRRLRATFAAFGVLALAASGPAWAQSTWVEQSAADADKADAEAEKAAGSSGAFQLSHSFSCEAECSHKFFKVPKGKTLNVTSFSCFNSLSPLYLSGFKADKTGEVSVVTPSSNGNGYYTANGVAPLLVRGGDKLIYIDIGSAAHYANCTIRGELR